MSYCKYRRITGCETECCNCTFKNSHYSKYDFNKICKQWFEENSSWHFNPIFTHSKELALWICKMKTGFDSENYFLDSEERMKMAFEMFKTIFLESVSRTEKEGEENGNQKNC